MKTMDQSTAYLRSLKVMKLNVVFILCLFTYFLYVFSQEFNHETSIKETPLIFSVEQLSIRIEEKLILLECIIQKEQCSHLSTSNIDFNPLLNALSLFKQQASLDKNQLSLVGAMEYIELEVSISKFKQTKSDDQQAFLNLYISLTQANLLIANSYRRLLDTHIYEHAQEESERLVELFLIFLFIALLGLYPSLTAIKEIRKLSLKEQLMASELHKIGDEIETLDLEHLNELLNETKMSAKKRRIYSYLKHIATNTEKQKRNNDLYTQLYAIIGYEMRSITNTIEGGVQFFLQDQDEDAQLMAKTILSSTNILTELSKNYNRMLSQGMTLENDEFNLLALIDELSITLMSQAKKNNKSVNLYITDHFPVTIYGQAINLFWMLFLQLSSTINKESAKHIFINVSSSSALSIEETRLNVTVYFLTQNDMTIKKLEKLFWSENTSLSANKSNFPETMSNQDVFYKSQWFESGEQQKLQILIDVKVKAFYDEKITLKGKKVILYCDSVLRVDVIEKSLKPTGIEIISVTSMNALMKLNKTFNKREAIIMSLTASESKLSALCKTVHSQLKKNNDTKLIVLVDELSQVISLKGLSDKNIYYPMLPNYLVENVNELLVNEDKDEGQKTKILIVEDDKVHQMLMKGVLDKLNTELHFVDDGIEALNYLQSNDAEIIFMDFIMPIIGGVQATQAIRKLESEQMKSPSIIIGLTALTSDYEHQSGLDAGMNLVLTKPFKPETIIKTVNKYVAIKKLQ